MNKSKIGALIGVFVVSLVFSGCGIQGVGIQKAPPDNKGGVYKSTDGAKSFEQKVKISETSSLGTSTILALALKPGDAETIYAGTKNGLYRTTDGGDLWEKMTGTYRTSKTADEDGKIEDDLKSVRDIVISSNNPDIMYVPSKLKGTGVGKIMKTTDGGSSWTEVFTQRTAEGSIFSLAIDQENYDTLYAGDSSGGIFKTDDGGETWKTLLWHKNGIKSINIDNVNSQKVYFVSSKSKGLRTDDGGENFIDIKSKSLIYNLLPHPYVENVIYVSDKNGLHYSSDGGETMNPIITLVHPKDINSRGIAVSPNDDKVIYFVSGKAIYKSVNAGETWKPIEFSIPRTIETVLINPEDTDILYLGTRTAQKKKSNGIFPF